MQAPHVAVAHERVPGQIEPAAYNAQRRLPRVFECDGSWQLDCCSSRWRRVMKPNPPPRLQIPAEGGVKQYSSHPGTVIEAGRSYTAVIKTNLGDMSV